MSQPKISLFSHCNIKRKKGEYVNEHRNDSHQDEVQHENLENIQDKLMDHSTSNYESQDCEIQDDQSSIIDQNKESVNLSLHSQLNEPFLDESSVKRKKFRSGDSAFSEISDTDHTELKPLGNVELQPTKLDLVLQQLRDIKIEINELKKDNVKKN